MVTKNLFSNMIAVFVLTCSFTATQAQSFGSFGKWVEQEAIPTIKGDRPLEVKPYVELNHNGQQHFYYNPSGNGSLRMSYGGVTLQTTNLAKREMQIARILSGDESVWYEIGAEQAMKEIERRQWANEPVFQQWNYNN